MINESLIYDVAYSALQKCPVMKFKTSPRVIMEVMNVPLCAVKSILREHRVSTSNIDETSICIDEKMLDSFADAYVRKLKNYFVSSSRHISSISDKERKDLKEFYVQFKKLNVNNENLGKWEDIDINLLYRSFYKKIRRLTKRKYPFLFYKSRNEQRKNEPFYFGLDQIFFDINNDLIKSRKRDFIEFPSIDEDLVNERREEILSALIFYHAYKPQNKQQNYLVSTYASRRKMFASARYYVFSLGDNHINN